MIDFTIEEFELVKNKGEAFYKTLSDIYCCYQEK
jgi:hypothetical protein